MKRPLPGEPAIPAKSGFRGRFGLGEGGDQLCFWKRARSLSVASITAVLLVVSIYPVGAQTVPDSGNERVSVSSLGAEANASSRSSGVSSDGRYVAFVSHATNLVEGDTNGAPDVFLRDALLKTTTRLSVDSSGTQAIGHSDAGDIEAFRLAPTISGDGRYVVFATSATNLYPGDTNGIPDVFLHDTLTGETQVISVGFPGGSSSGAGSPNAYTLGSYAPVISGDGRFVAFNSNTTNLVPNDLNGRSDVFRYDRVAQSMTRVSVSSAGLEANGHSDGATMSATGNLVAFNSRATNLVGGDTNLHNDVFVKDLSTGSLTRVSLSATGTQSTPNAAVEGSLNPSINANGTQIAFQSDAGGLGRPPNERHVYVTSLAGGATPISPVPSWMNMNPSISGDGRLIAFQSDSQLIPQDTNGSTDVYVYDSQTATLARGSARPLGDNEPGRRDSTSPAISVSGTAVSFDSSASNLAPGDTNNEFDVYVSKGFENPPQSNGEIKNYVALGDSFSAGEGVEPYDAGTDTDENRCHRSAGAYARFVADPSDQIPIHGKAQVDPTFSWRFVACSGATTENVRSATNDGSPQFNEPGTQLDQGAAGSDADLITITIGGNDAEYADVMEECFFHACTSPGFEKDGVPFTDWVEAKVDAVPLQSTYADIRGHAPSALILTLGYPKLLPPDIPVTCPTLVPYQEEEDFLNSMGDRLNLRIAQAANAEGATYLSVDQAFEGHWVCGDKGEWINGPSATGDWGWPPLTARSKVFHPNFFGHQGYAQVVNEFLQGTWRGDGSSASSASNSGQPVRQHPSRVRLEGPLGSIDPLEITTTRANSCIREVAGSLRLRGSDFAPNSDVEITATIPDEIPIELDATTADERGVVTRWIDIPGVLEGELVGFEMRGIDRDGGERWLITPVRVPSDDDTCGVSAGSVRILGTR